MKYLRIAKWNVYQTYRGDRGQPPWIKVHRKVLRSTKWAMLSDAQRGQLVAIWVLAADKDGVIPASPALVKKLCYMDSEPDLQLLMEIGFIEHDANVASEWRQSDRPESEAEAEAEADIMSSSRKAANIDAVLEGKVSEVIDHFKETTGKTRVSTTSKSNRAHVRARINEGVSVDDLKALATLKTGQVKAGTFKDQYLRIETLYNETKCQSYLAELDAIRSGTQQATVDFVLLQSLEFELSERGYQDARQWITRQKPELHAPLRRHLDSIAGGAA